jgi:hypothetical protein
MQTMEEAAEVESMAFFFKSKIGDRRNKSITFRSTVKDGTLLRIERLAA